MCRSYVDAYRHPHRSNDWRPVRQPRQSHCLGVGDNIEARLAVRGGSTRPAAGHFRPLRGEYVDRAGHAEFTAAETIAAVEALDERIGGADWAAVADTRSLQ